VLTLNALGIRIGTPEIINPVPRHFSLPNNAPVNTALMDAWHKALRNGAQ
jgi:hypothetical protein